MGAADYAWSLQRRLIVTEAPITQRDLPPLNGMRVHTVGGRVSNIDKLPVTSQSHTAPYIDSGI